MVIGADVAEVRGVFAEWKSAAALAVAVVRVVGGPCSTSGCTLVYCGGSLWSCPVGMFHGMR